MPEHNVGSFRHLVALEKPVRATSARGVPQVTGWERIGTYHAAMRGLTGREFFEAAAAKQQDLVIFYLRCGVEVTCQMRLVHLGKPYDIYSVREVDAGGVLRQEVRARLTEVQR